MTRRLELQHFHWRWESDRSAAGLMHSHPEAVFHAIDTAHDHKPPRIITAYANERRAFVRCAVTGHLHEHFHLDEHGAADRLSRYELHNFTGSATALHQRTAGSFAYDRRATG